MLMEFVSCKEQVKMYLATFLLTVCNLKLMINAERRSALIQQVQVIPNGTSTSDKMMCAFRMMKLNYVGARTARDSYSCEELSASKLVPSKLEKGFEYLRKTTVFYYNSAFTEETAMHILFSDVKIGDKFQFVIEKKNIDGFSIAFKDTSSNRMLVFEDNSDVLELNVRLSDTWGVAEIPTYPFDAIKEYKLLFEVLETHWQIYIDDSAFTTFNHRQPFTDIKRILVKTGQSAIYRTKWRNPQVA